MKTPLISQPTARRHPTVVQLPTFHNCSKSAQIFTKVKEFFNFPIVIKCSGHLQFTDSLSDKFLMKFAFLVFALIFTTLPSFAKRTVCTITLNSDNERKLFTSKYKKEDLQFVELTDFKRGHTNQDEWLDKACESGVKCDSLIISGHFGGTFFGEDSPLTLPLSTLEKKACAKSCDGVLSHPKEVYLFGCNTLADKKIDRRTPAEYRQVLINDGISEEYVDRIVAARYSPIGESFKMTMQKVFSGVPQIYGFDSIGPSGKTVSSFLNNYLGKIPNYSERINQLEAAKVVSQIEKSTEISQRFSGPWNSSMKGTAYSSCVGAPPTKRKECELFDDRKSGYEKMLTIESLLNEPNRKDHFLTIEEYFRGKDLSKLSEDELAVLRRIRGNQQAANELIALLPKLNSVLETKFPMMGLAEKLGWIEPKTLNLEYEKTLKSAFKGGFGGNKVASFCSIENPPTFSASQIQPEWFKNNGFLDVLQCWQGPKRAALPEHYTAEIKKQLDSTDSDKVLASMSILTANLKTDRDLQVKLAGFLYSEDLSISASAMTRLSDLRDPNGQVLTIIARGLDSTDQSQQRRSAYTIRNMKIQDAELKRKALQIDPSMQPW